MTLNKCIQRLFKTNLLWGGCVVLLFLASCDKDNYDPCTEEREEIRFEIGFDPLSRVATDAAFRSGWEIGDEIGLYIVQGEGGLLPLGNYVDNLRLEFTHTGWSYTLPSGKEFYPNDGRGLSFYAYYPYNPSMSDPSNYLFSVEPDQSAGINYNKSDLLLAKTEDYRRTQSAVPLNFRHALSLLQIEVASEGGISQPDDNLQVSITNILPDARGNLQTSMVTEGIRKTVSMQKVTGLAHTYRALIPAQTLGADTKIIFIQTTSGKQINMEYAGLQTVSLEAGRVHKYKITLSDL